MTIGAQIIGFIVVMTFVMIGLVVILYRSGMVRDYEAEQAAADQRAEEYAELCAEQAKRRLATHVDYCSRPQRPASQMRQISSGAWVLPDGDGGWLQAFFEAGKEPR